MNTMSTDTAKRGMTRAHKDALAAGRTQSHAVKAYLTALKENKPKRGRKRTAESITKRLAQIPLDLVGADALQELLLIQEQANLTAELSAMTKGVDLTELTQGFIDVGLAYTISKGISYTTWRKVGVPTDVLKRAGIPRI